MPKLDPADQATSMTTTAPAPLQADQTSPSGFGSVSTPTTGGFGSAQQTFSTSPSGSSTFGSTSPSGFNSPSPGSFGSAPSTGGFGSSGGFGGASGGSFGGAPGGFGGFGSFTGGMSTAPQQQAAASAEAFGNVMAAESTDAPEHWMKSFWRPAMGWLYMLICFADFIAFPLLSMFLPLIERGFGVQVGYTAWQSLTLSNGGLIHLAFGAILGVSAYGRTQEKKS